MPVDLEKLLSSLPEGTTRVRVKTPLGVLSYKKPEDINEQDELVLSPTGFPVVMRGKPGASIKALGGNQTQTAVTSQPAGVSHPPSAVVDLSGLEDSEVEKVEQVRNKRKRRHHKNDVLKEVKKNSSSDSVFDVLMSSLAEEAELVEFERDRLIQLGQPAHHLTEQRVKVIKAMTDSWLKRRSKFKSNGVDMESPAFSVVFSFILETVRAAMEDAGMRSEYIETVFNKLSNKLNEEWKVEANIRIRDRIST
jgi:hypothetical protein